MQEVGMTVAEMVAWQAAAVAVAKAAASTVVTMEEVEPMAEMDTLERGCCRLPPRSCGPRCCSS